MLDEFNLKLPAGETTAICGMSGAGTYIIIYIHDCVFMHVLF